MDEIAPEYDVVVLGTGKALAHRNLRCDPLITRRMQASPNVCSLGVYPPYSWTFWTLTDYGSVLSVQGQKVLHIDRNE